MMESKWEPVSESMQNVSESSASMSKSGGGIKAEGVKNGDFPAGLRVLVVDDDPICLLILDRLLRECHYQVRTCDSAVRALELLREKKDSFDLVISDVHMPDMDGFKLLELVGLEMDLPVIMMSANSDTSAVMKGVVHGACDYLLKPVRLEELKNIWQHVLRKQNKVAERPSKQRHFTDDGDSNTSGTHLRKRKSFKEEDEEEDEEEEEEGEDERDRDNDDPSSAKKPRVVWSVELHQQFVNAVNQLGIDKAVPKRILELMNVQSLTRENVASHLQKYRLYLKRIHGHPQGALSSPFTGASDLGFGFVMGGESNSLAAAHLSQQALISSLQASLFGKLNTANLGANTGIDPTLFLQFASTHGLDNEGLVKSLYGQPSQYGQAASLSNAGSDLKQGGQHTPGLSQYGQSSQYGQASLSNSGPDLKKGGQHTLGLSQYGQPLQYAQASSDLKQGGQHTSGLSQYGQPSQYGQSASFSNASPDLKPGVQHTSGLSQYGQPLQYGQASPELKQAGQLTPGLSQYGQPLQYGQTSLPDANPALKQGGQYTSGFSQYGQPSQYGQASLLNGGPDLKHGAQHTPGLSLYSQTSQYAQASLSNVGPDLKQGGQHTPGLSQYGQNSQYGQPSQYGQTSSSNASPDLKPGGQHTPVLSGLQDNNLVGPNGMRQLGKSGSLLAGDHPNGNALIMQIGICSGFDISNEDAVQMRSGHLSPLVASNCRLDRFPQSESKESHTLSGSILQIPSKLKGSPTLTPSSHHNDLDASDVKRLGTHGLATLAGLDYSTHNLGMSSRIPKAWEHSQPGQKSGQIQIQHSITNTQIYDGLAKNQIDRAGEQGLAQESVLSDHHESSIPLALVADGSNRFKSSLRNTPYNNGPSALDVEWKVKEVSLGLSASKAGNSSLVESFQPSDDLLNFVLKQQQGGLGFTDNGMATDGFRLNEM